MGRPKSNANRKPAPKRNAGKGKPNPKQRSATPARSWTDSPIWKMWNLANSVIRIIELVGDHTTAFEPPQDDEPP